MARRGWIGRIVLGSLGAILLIAATLNSDQLVSEPVATETIWGGVAADFDAVLAEMVHVQGRFAGSPDFRINIPIPLGAVRKEVCVMLALLDDW